jgi:phosphosulfolactate synthase
MVADWGMGLNAQEDLLTTGGAYLDFAKIAVGLSRVLPNDVLRAKVERYRRDEVEPFPGGQYLEYAEVRGVAELYLPAVAKAGYRWVEVSDNLVPASLEWKQRMIRRATEEYGLSVMGEVGKKEGLDKMVSLVDDAKACLDASASIILLEAAELVSQDPATTGAVEEVVKEVGLERVMFELPGPWIPGVTHDVIHRMRRQLIESYGTQVNLGNVAAEDLMSLEAFRQGLGVNAGGGDAQGMSC